MTLTYRGTVRNGVVVFDGAAPLADGTPVVVEAARTETAPGPRPGSPEAVLSADVRWVGDPSEFDRLMEEVQRAREEDLALELKRERESGAHGVAGAGE